MSDSRRLIEHLDAVGCLAVEFLYDGTNAYFLEVNGYIQPTHLVTHALTGINLLAEQIRIFANERLPFGQQDIVPRGHALAVSLNAEDPGNNFIPSTGALDQRFMFSSMGVTVHKAFVEGERLSNFYEPVLAQVVATDYTREQVINKLLATLRCFILEGIKTNISFIEAVINSAIFRAGKMYSTYIFEPKVITELMNVGVDEREEDIAALLAAITLANDTQSKNAILSTKKSPFSSLGNLVGRLFNRNSSNNMEDQL